MDTFDLFALKLAGTQAGEEYALAVYPPTNEPEPAESPCSQLTFGTIEQLCSHLNALEFGSENSLAVLLMALQGSLESEGATFHIAHINEAGARAIGFQL